MIEILNWKAQSDPKVLVLFDVFLPKIYLYLRNFRVLKGKSGKHFIASPSFLAGKDSNGKSIWKPIFEFSELKQKEFMAKVWSMVESEIVKLEKDNA